MKNKIFLFITFLFLILSGCSSHKKDAVAVTVYNNDILIKEIENAVEISNFVYEQATEQISDLNIDADEKKLLNEISKPKTYDEVLNEKIEYFVLLHEAEKLGLRADLEECRSEAKQVFSNLNSISEDDFENYQTRLLINKYMELNNLSDDEYIEQLTNQYYNNACINLLKDNFKNNNYTQSELSFEQQYSNYVQELIDDAKIVYYN